jgi:hypothetical protein
MTDLPAESVTWTVNDLASMAAGVPEIRPPADRANPDGSDPEAIDHV